MDTDCVFCRIVAGLIPANQVYETDEVLAFLDINPIEKGHTLVIPKAHFQTLMDTPGPVAAQMIEGVRRVAAGQMAVGAQGVNVLQSNHACAGQEVPHLHFHVIPRRDTGKPRSWVSGGARYDSAEDREQTAQRLHAAISAAAVAT